MRADAIHIMATDAGFKKVKYEIKLTNGLIRHFKIVVNRAGFLKLGKVN